jgi:hypothetical protein
MALVYKELNLSIQIRAEDLEVLHFLVSKEFQRIAVESPAAFDSPCSWAEHVDRLHNQLTFLRDSNFVHR